MIIHEIKLRNFRNHVEKTFRFTKGINLIYGKNGSGKTSILEAIGHLLFAANLRGGKSIKDAVSENQDSFQIEIKFSANDGVVYLAETNSNSIYKLSQLNEKGNPQHTAKSKDVIIKKINEIIGNKINSERLFSDIIVASQNKITDLFLDTDGDKSKNFNKLFNTEIYNTISEIYLKNFIRNLENEIKSISSLIISMEAQIENPDVLNQLYNSVQKNLKDLTEEINKTNTNIEDLQRNINEQQELINKIKSENEILTSKQKYLEEIEKSIFFLDSELEKALNSRKIIEERKEEYESYISKNYNFDLLEKELNQLDKIRDESAELKDELSKKENLTTQKDEQIISKENLINDYNDNLIKSQSEKSKSKDEIKKLELKLNKQNELISIFDTLSKECLAIENDENSFLDNLRKINDEILFEQKNLINLDQETENQNRQFEIINALNLKLEERNKINSNIDMLNDRLKTNSEAAEKLSSKICPFLVETCKNIETGSDAVSYFENKKQEILSELAKNKIFLVEFKNLDQERESASQENERIKNSIAAHQKAIQNIEIRTKEIEKIESDLKNIKSKFKILFLENSALLENHNLQSSEISTEKLKEISIKYNNEINLIQNNLSNEQTIFNNNQNTIRELNTKIENTKNEIKEINNQLLNLEKDKLEINIKIADNNSKLVNYYILKEKKDSLKIEIDGLKPFYEKYMKNIDQSKKVESINSKILESKQNHEKIKIEIDEKKINLENLKTNVREGEIERITNELNSFKSILNTKNTEKEILISEKSNLELRLKNYQKSKDELKFLYSERKIFESKLKYSNEFNKNLKKMGQLIANKLLLFIQEKATENYSMISGRTEKIIWRSDEKSSYNVFLKLENGYERNFKQLSGGEQMMTALSLRAAINSILTNSRFAIFDEPTVNLDNEKRKALSESLDKILISLDQAIIVTHDDAFSEMAQNVIEL